LDISKVGQFRRKPAWKTVIFELALLQAGERDIIGHSLGNLKITFFSGLFLMKLFAIKKII